MSSRRVKIVLVCEDSQQEAFSRRFLKGMGWNTRELRVEKSPSGGGSAEQWVREKYPNELSVYRNRQTKAASALIVMIDADNKTVQDRINDFDSECNLKQLPPRAAGESVAIFIPKRNIETWIHYLNDNQVNEDDAYPKLQRERECLPAVQNLINLCHSSGLAADAPASLKLACDEYRVRIVS